MISRLVRLAALVTVVAAGSALCIGANHQAGAEPQPKLGPNLGPLGVQGLPQVEVTAIRQTIVAWTAALAAGDLDLWDSFWAKGSVFMPPGGGRITGDAKLNAIAKTPPYDDIAKATFSDWAIAGREDLAVVMNNITVENKAGGDSTVAQQLIVMRRQESGAWLVQAVMFNALAP